MKTNERQEKRTKEETRTKGGNKYWKNEVTRTGQGRLRRNRRNLSRRQK
jgi:hypothetical protein